MFYNPASISYILASIFCIHASIFYMSSLRSQVYQFVSMLGY
jgi:hypothetical protein